MDHDVARIGVRVHDRRTVLRVLEAYERLGSTGKVAAELGGVNSRLRYCFWE